MPGAGRRPCVPAPAPPHPGPRAAGGAEGTDHGRGAGGKDRPLPCPGAEKAPAVESLGFGGGGGRPGLPRRAGRPARPEQRRRLHARDGRRPRRDGASRGRCRPGAGGRPPGGPCRGGSRLESALGGGPRLTGPFCGAALRGSLFRRGGHSPGGQQNQRRNRQYGADGGARWHRPAGDGYGRQRGGDHHHDDQSRCGPAG